MRTRIQDRIPQDLYQDMYNRRKTVREVAKILGVSENYLSHAIPERAPKRNPKLLKVTRRMYQNQIARETLQGKHTVVQGAELAHVSERTFYRRLKAIKINEGKE